MRDPGCVALGHATQIPALYGLEFRFKILIPEFSPLNDNNISNNLLISPRYSINSDTIHEAEEDAKSEDTVADDDMPALSEFLLTAADILSLR